MRDLNFNTEGREAPSYTPIPEGWYPATVEDCEWKQTRAGDGEYLELVIVITAGAQRGRKLWERLNLDNPKPRTVEIAESTLTAICLANGLTAIKNPRELLFKDFEVRVRHREYRGELRAEPRGYRAPSAARSDTAGNGAAGNRAAGNMAAQTNAAPAQAATSVAPWKRGA